MQAIQQGADCAGQEAALRSKIKHLACHNVIVGGARTGQRFFRGSESHTFFIGTTIK